MSKKNSIEKYNTKHGEFYKLPLKYLEAVAQRPKAAKFLSLYEKHLPYNDKKDVAAFLTIFESYLYPNKNLDPRGFNSLQEGFDHVLALDGFKDIEYRHDDRWFRDSPNQRNLPREDKLLLYRRMRQFQHCFEGWRHRSHRRVWDLYCQKGKTLEEIGRKYYTSRRTELAGKPVSKTAIFYIVKEYKDIMSTWSKKGYFESNETEDLYNGIDTTGFYTFEQEVLEEIDREREEERKVKKKDKDSVSYLPSPVLDSIVEELINS